MYTGTNLSYFRFWIFWMDVEAFDVCAVHCFAQTSTSTIYTPTYIYIIASIESSIHEPIQFSSLLVQISVTTL